MDKKMVEFKFDERSLEVIALHRPCTGVEHNPSVGKMHGCCVRCGEPWPCSFSPERNNYARPITQEDIIRECNQNYDVGRKHGQEEKAEEIKSLHQQLALERQLGRHLEDEVKNLRKEITDKWQFKLAVCEKKLASARKSYRRA